MPAVKNRKPAVKPVVERRSGAVEYRGTQTRTGNSLGFRFEGALFKSHPEFNGAVKAQVIAPGRMLVTTERVPQESTDLAMESFLAFLAQDITRNPQQLRPLDRNLMKQIEKLTKGVKSDPKEDLGDVALL